MLEVRVPRAGVTIRQATRDDVDALVAFISSADPGVGTLPRPAVHLDSPQMADRLLEVIDAGLRTLLIAVDETGDGSHHPIVGLLAATVEDIGAVDLTPALHVTHLLVAPDHRRRGVGRALLAAATTLAEERGVDRVVATVAAQSRDANRYLARLGFAPLVVDRIASTATLRRALGLTDRVQRRAVVRRARVLRAQRGNLAVGPTGRGF